MAESSAPTLVMARRGGPMVLDRYRLAARLGSGGFGEVWLARDERLERDVAVKVIPRARVAGERAEREARAAARLAHPAIVRLYEAGSDADNAYLVSELVRGRTLADLLEEGALSDRDIARVGVALCDALEHAHAQGVIHRDVKPSNVLVPDEAGRRGITAKLTDFGVARISGGDLLTRTGDIVGTLAYMAPEQAEGLAVGESADLYSLAILLYEALSGVNPVRGHGPADTARRLGARLPSLRDVRRDLPRELTAAIDHALEPAPEARGGLGELRAALAASAGELDTVTGIVAGGGVIARMRDTVTRPREYAEEELAPRAPRERAVRPRLPLADRALAAVSASVVAGAADWLLTLQRPLPPLAAAAAAALATAVLPRLGWLVCAGAALAWLAIGPGLGGIAIVCAAAVALVPLLLVRTGAVWSVPAFAPALGLVSLAGAFPALAARARSAWTRLALGAIGFCWLAATELVSGRQLFFGIVPRAHARASWEGSARLAIDHALVPTIASGMLACAVLWGAAAVVLPWVVRGRSALLDLVAATGWAAALAAGTSALARPLEPHLAHATPRGLTLGALAGAALALTLHAPRGRAAPAPLP